MPKFDNRLCRELPVDPVQENYIRQVSGAIWSPVDPTPTQSPRLIAHSQALAETLGLTRQQLESEPWVSALSGNGKLEGMAHYASCYGGHQFGSWAGQLGDGRAIYLGELLTEQGVRWEMQLKGAGKTPYSRQGDGRAVLRSSLREFLCSEAMHHLGVPTTRALSLVLTGDQVVRDMLYDGNPQQELGAVVCRVAPSFTRFGHFEIHSSRDDHALLRQLADFTIDRDFNNAFKHTANRYANWYLEVCRRTAATMAQWMGCGFVHGVMNTDNMSILGLTIDYGPYGWLEDFDPGWTPNTTDAAGRRYCFARQPSIALWNLERLGEALLPLLKDDEVIKEGALLYESHYTQQFQQLYRAKLGVEHWGQAEDTLLQDLFGWMVKAEIDMTDLFRRLATLNHQQSIEQQIGALQPASYNQEKFSLQHELLEGWLARYRQLLPGEQGAAERQAQMEAVNPRYILRNYLAQEAIELAEQGDYSRLNELLEVIKEPYREQPGREQFAALRPEWASNKPGCSMLSCSS